MGSRRSPNAWAALLACVMAVLPTPAAAQLMISGNDGKLDLSTGDAVVLPRGERVEDSVTLLDWGRFPPAVTHITGVRNSVLGPPTNVAITPNEHLGLVASSVRLLPGDGDQVPDTLIQVLDLTADPPAVIDRVRVGLQPSGLAVAPSGRLALVANRADSTVSVLSIRGRRVRLEGQVTVCAKGDEPSHVAINPAGDLALVTIRRQNVVRFLRIEGTRVTRLDAEVPVYPNPYRALITPDGATALVAGGTAGANADAISVIDLTAQPFRSVDHVVAGSGIESIDISPDGRMVVAAVMNGSNVPADSPIRTEHGLVVVYALEGVKLTRVQDVPVGRIPEGIAFSPDGCYVVVQHYVDRELAVFAVEDGRLIDTEVRIPVPGMPASLRTSAGR